MDANAEQVFKIGVFGSAGGIKMNENMQNARIIGKEIASSESVVCTGACKGLPLEAALAAADNGGSVLGFSPAAGFTEHVEKYKLPVYPHLLIFAGPGFKDRNLVSTRTCDAGIFIAGRWGTLNEFTLMVDEEERKVIGLLKNSGGFVDDSIIPGLRRTDKSTKAVIVIDDDPKALVERVVGELSKRKGRM
jgi:predicted Rossmann-fold nucleotide-binding protein